MVETYRDKFNKKYGLPKGTSNSLRDISTLTGYKQSGLKTIFNKGVGAYKTNPQSVRPTVKSPEQWAYGRVYSAVMGGKAAAIDASHLKK
jgi:alkyl sulfatase BDS1-like metallo-beta-lactamase superfamily hydrolase